MKTDNGKMTSVQLQNLEILDLAYDQAKFQTKIILPLGDHVIVAILEAIDIKDIWREQKILKAQIFQKYCEAGWDKEDYDKELWKQTLENLNDEQKKKAEPPKSKAEQYSQSESFLETVISLIPKRLKDIDGNLLFPTEDSLQKISKFIWTNPSMLSLIQNAYLEVSNLVEKTAEEAKNE